VSTSEHLLIFCLNNWLCAKLNKAIKGVKSEFLAINDGLLLQYYAKKKTPEEIAKLLNEKPQKLI